MFPSPGFSSLRGLVSGAIYKKETPLTCRRPALHWRATSISLAVAISAAGLSNLAADPDNHWRVLESGNMLKMLLRALVLDHALAQHHILRLLCGLVSNEATQADVVSAGVVRAVQEMGNRDMHASDISLILFNISCNPSLSGRYAQLLVRLESCLRREIFTYD